MTVPVSAGRRQRLWTPSSWRGRGEVRQPWGKLSGHQDSRERSRSFWFPTIWQQLEGKICSKRVHVHAQSVTNGIQGAGPSLQVGQEAAPQTVALLRGNDQPRAQPEGGTHGGSST